MLYKETKFRDSPIGKIPLDWSVTNFGETFTYQKGKKPLRLEEKYSKGFLPYLSTQYLRQNGPHSFALDSKDVVSIRNDDLILLWDGSNAGEFFLGKEGILSSTMVKIKVNEEKFKTLFLFYFLKTRERYIQSQTKGTGIPHVDGNVLDRLAVPIPKLPEQEKIVDVLGVVDSALELADQVIAKSERLKRGLMQQLLTYGIGHTEYSYNEAIGFNVPTEWTVKTFKDISNVRQGLQIAISERYKEKGKNRYPYITIQYLNNSKDERNIFFVENPKSTVVCNKNDILMTRTGNTGAVITDVEGVFHNNFFIVDFDREVLTKEFLVHYLNCERIQKIIRAYAGSTTVPDLDHGDFYRIPVVIPTIPEQKKIADILSTVNKKLQIENQEKAKLERVKAGLMNLLLAGKVRIKVD